MATVFNTINLPTGETPAHATVRIVLVASTSGEAPGYDEDRVILGRETVSVTDGEWDADLTPNAEITPENTYYEVTESAGGYTVTHTIRATSGGPHWIGDLLISPPDAISAAALDTHAAAEASARIAGDALRISLIQKGAANGVAELDADSKVPLDQLPDSVATANGLLVAPVIYDPVALSTMSTTSSTPADLDADNLVVTFTVPSNGAVCVILTAVAGISAVATYYSWLLREAGTTVPGSIRRVIGNQQVQALITCRIYINGLTPDDELTWTWGHKRDAGGGTCSTFAQVDGHEATIEVWSGNS